MGFMMNVGRDVVVPSKTLRCEEPAPEAGSSKLKRFCVRPLRAGSPRHQRVAYAGPVASERLRGSPSWSARDAVRSRCFCCSSALGGVPAPPPTV
eukprot:3285039-Prymnesium_polylepis.1